MSVGCAILLVIALLPYLPPLAPHRWPNPWRLELIVLLALGEATLFALAARRRALGVRLRQSMALFSAALLLVAISDTLVIAMRLPTTGPALARINDVLELVYSGLGVAALFWMPLAPVRGYGRWLVLTDIMIGVAGMALVMFATTTLVDLEAAGPTEHARILQYGIMTGLNLAVLNTILVRGLDRQVGSGIWFLAGTTVLEIVYWVIVQLRLAHPELDARLLDVVFAADQVCYMLAALAFLTAPIDTRADHPVRYRHLQWTRTVNPLPVLSVGAAGVLLLIRAFSSDGAVDLRAVSVGTALVTSLLVVRMILSVQDRVALVQDEAKVVARLQDERATALRRIAGGVAHEFNNLLAVIIGNAELGAADAADVPQVASCLRAIRDAGDRAASLTRRLRTFAAGDPIAFKPTDVGEMVNAMRPTILSRAGDRITVELALDGGAATALANTALMETALLHLVANSIAAMPGGGRLIIAVSTRRVGVDEFQEAILAAPPGDYVQVAVADSGPGIPIADQRRIFDPFFSTRSLAVSAGLGLAVVHGTMAAHHGAITIRSSPTHGTTIRLFLPLSG